MKAFSALLVLTAGLFVAAAPVGESVESVEAVEAVESVPDAEPKLVELVPRQYTGRTTQNQIKDGTACRAVTVIFARGTTEAGNVGLLAGPPFFQALASSIGSTNLAVQGVDYPALISGFLVGGDPAGSVTMASLVSQTVSRCPNTKIVLSGYSQGGQLVHNAAALLSTANAAKISSVVIFGDPEYGRSISKVSSSKVLVICHLDDAICAHTAVVLPSHLTYSIDASRAAAHVKRLAGL